MIGEAVEATREIVAVNVAERQRTYGMAQVALTKRYSGSALGVTWAVLRPIIYIAAYWFAVTVGLRGARSPVAGAPYLLWLVPGIMAWFFVNECLTHSGNAIRSNAQFVTKMAYPVPTLPVSSVLSYFLVHVLMMGLTLILFLVSGYGLGLTILQLPYFMLCSLALGVVFAMLFSALTAISADIQHAIRSLMTLLFWLSPVLWSATGLPGPIKVLVMANPISYVLGGYRQAFVLHQWVFSTLPYTLYFWALLGVTALLAGFVYSKLAPEFADVL